MQILSIDGGGIRGYFAAYFLARVESVFRESLRKRFDLICGTSTGSIIAAALAADYPLEKVMKLYEDRGRHIFKKVRGSVCGIVRARYDIESLKKELNCAFGNRTLSNISTRLLIPATDIANAQVHVFKSAYSEEFVRDKDVRLADAVLASCAAPTYFAPAYVDPYLLADGGLWANNPALVGFMEAISRLGVKPADVKLLSIGTGTGEKYYPVATRGRPWGVVTGWGGTQLVDLLLNLQSKNTDNMMKLMLPPEQYLRINFFRESKLSLDDVESLPELRSMADRLFTENSKAIRAMMK